MPNRKRDPMEEMLGGFGGMPGGPPPMDLGPPDMGGMPQGGMPPGGPPEMQEMGEMQPPEGQIPNSGTVDMIDGDNVVITTDIGMTVTLPLAVFPFPPKEGSQVVKAVVQSVDAEMMVALVGAEEIPVDIPVDRLNTEFGPGDFFWMPAPPSAPPEAMDEMF